MRQHIREQIMIHAENSYAEFSAALIPKSKPLLGVRLPKLRELAKVIVKREDWRQEICSYEGEYEDIYFEEVMLRGMIIGYGTEKVNIEEALSCLEVFIPHVDNWSVCDSFCASFSTAAKHRVETWEFLQKYLYSDKEFEVRVALILLLDQYLKYNKDGKKLARKRVITMDDVCGMANKKTRNEAGRLSEMGENDVMSSEMTEQYPYLERILQVLNRPYLQGYYAQMAAAWTTAEAFVTFPYETMQMLERQCQMDDWTYNKALQKICESKNPDDEVKCYIKHLRR